MAKRISTLRGEISTDDLGFTLIHEHLFFIHQDEWKKQSITHLREKLADFKEAGGKTIVDLTPYRRMDWIQEACAGMDLNFILCTGYYLESKQDFTAKTRTLQEHMDFMEKDIVEGIGGTKVKAGIIKIAGDKEKLTPWEERVFEAAAKVSVKRKIPIATHACAGAAAQQKVLQKAGADLRHVFYSHPEAKFGWEGRDVKQEAQWMLDIVKEGSSLMFNNFDFTFDTPENELYYLMRFLADKGHMNSILISIDMNFEFTPEGKVYHEAEKEHPETKIRTFAYTITHIAKQYLIAHGFSKSEVDTIFIENPKRFFEYV